MAGTAMARHSKLHASKIHLNVRQSSRGIGCPSIFMEVAQSRYGKCCYVKAKPISNGTLDVLGP
jgi:hypothetical protein